MTKDEALELALEALERSVATCFDQYAHQQVMSQPDHFINKAITAIKEALVQEQEPVAWMFQHDETGRMNYVSNDGIHDPTMFLGMNPRYALVCPLYTSPPQSTQVKLTDEEILEIASPMFEDTRYPSTALDFARAILRKAQKK